MRILMLTQYYAPEPHDKFTSLAKGLAARGHEVQVITGFPCYPLGKTYDGWRQRVYSEETSAGVLVTRVPQAPDHSRSALRRVAYYLSFALSAATIGLWRSRAADVVLVYQAALPVGFAGWVLSLWRRAPLVLDVVDLWPESVEASGMLSNRRLMGMIRFFAKRLYRRAKHVSVITHGYADRIASMGIDREKIGVIHMWPRREPACAAPAENDAECRLPPADFVCLYTGAMGPCQDLGVVLESAALLRDEQRIAFALVGDGVCHDELVSQKETLQLDNVHFLGRLPPEALPPLCQAAGALLLHLKPDPMSRVSIPSKTIDYLATGRPVIAAIEGETAELISRGGCGLAIAPRDPARLAEAILQLANDRSFAEACARGSRTTFQEKFSAATQIDKFGSLLEGMALTREPQSTPSIKRAA